MRENFVTGSFMQFTLREMTVIARSPRLWTTFVVIVFIFTITGPFGTNTMPPAIRFFYWLTIQFAGWSNAILFAVLADALLDRWITSIFTRMMLGSLAAALPIGLWIGLIDYGFSAQPLTVQAFRTNAAISLPLSALFCVLAYMTLKQEIEIIPRAASQAPALLARLRPDIRGPFAEALRGRPLYAHHHKPGTRAHIVALFRCAQRSAIRRACKFIAHTGSPMLM